MHALGVPRDDHEAVRWFRKSANQNHAGAQNNLGIMYSEGWGVEQKDEKEAIKLFCQAKNSENEDAAVNLGIMYLKLGVVYDQQSEILLEDKYKACKEAKKLLCPYKKSNARVRYYYWSTLPKESEKQAIWRDRAYALGNLYAKNNLAEDSYDEDHDYQVEDRYYNLRYPDYQDAVLFYERQDEEFILIQDQEESYHPTPEFQFIMENREYFGVFVRDPWGKFGENNHDDNNIESRKIYEWLDLENNIESSEDLWRDIGSEADTFILKRFIRITDIVLDADYSKKNEYWSQALQHLREFMSELHNRKKSDKNDAVYEYYSALIFLFEDKEIEAEKCFRMAIASSNIDGKGNLDQKIAYWRGLMHLRGGASIKAREYFENAAKTGFAEAQYEIGLIYLEEKRTRKAKEWFDRAAEQGHSRAAYQLGLMYLCGQDEASRDYQKAKECFQQARSIRKKKNLKEQYYRYQMEEDFSQLGYIYVNAMRDIEEIHRKEIHAMFNLATIYLCGGYGIEKQYETAKKYFAMAIDADRYYADITKEIQESIKLKGIEMLLKIVKEADDRVVRENTVRLICEYKKDGIEWVLDSIVEASDDDLREMTQNLLKTSINHMTFAYLLLHKHKYLRRLVAPHVNVGREVAVYQYWYALSFLFGNEIPKADEWFQKADDLFQKAASDSECDDKRDFRPMIRFWRGCMYLRDDIESIFDTKKNEALVKSKEYFKAAANGGLAEAQYEVGLMYLGEKKTRKAEECFDRAAKGHSRAAYLAAYQLGLMYFHGQDEIPKDFSKAKDKFEEMMNSDDLSGTLDLGKLGHLSKYKNPVREISRYDCDVDQDRTGAMFRLAYIYLSERNNNESIKYFSQAAGMIRRLCPLWKEKIKGLDILLGSTLETTTNIISHESLVELLEQPAFHRSEKNDAKKIGAIKWLLRIAEVGDEREQEKAEDLLVKYVHFLKNHLGRDISQMNTLIDLFLIVAKAGDDEKRKNIRKLLAERMGHVKQFVWHRIWDAVRDSKGQSSRKIDRLRELIRPHIDEEIGREDKAAVYKYFYALSFLFSPSLEAKEAKKQFDQILTSTRIQENELREFHHETKYWLGHICLRDGIQEGESNNKEQILAEARGYFMKLVPEVPTKEVGRTDRGPRGGATTGKKEQFTEAQTAAMHEAGLMFRDGIGGEKNPRKAEELFKRAADAEQHHSRSAYQLGLMYFHGQGEIQKNSSSAKKYFQDLLPKESEELIDEYDGGTTPKYNLDELGYIYKAGAWKIFDGWNPVIFKDTIWMEQADALANLGFIHLYDARRSFKVEETLDKAKKFFERAAKACHADAMFNLGLMLLKNGDRTEAIECFEKAWEGDIECDECGPEGRYEYIKQFRISTEQYEDEIKWSQELGPGTPHVESRKRKLQQKLYSCSSGYQNRITSEDWWPRYRGNWLALYYLAILYSDVGDNENAERCREKLQMTGFTMPAYMKREMYERMKVMGTAKHS